MEIDYIIVFYCILKAVGSMHPNKGTHCSHGKNTFVYMCVCVCKLSYSCPRELTSVNYLFTIFVQRKNKGNESLRQNITVIVLFLLF